MNIKSKFIFVTGGTLSGLGKGVSAASIGRMLKARGYHVFVQKYDPYYNLDPGTMSPYQHGEVYVTTDGAETDLDLGHYERFIGESFTRLSNFTQGKLLQELLNEERDGLYGGKTIQIIPHLTDKIISKLLLAANTSNADFIIVEIGGTVGDIESQPFLSAISQFNRKYKNSSFFAHTTYLPFLEASSEFKTKPGQHSITNLQSFGINPNMLLVRANKDIPDLTMSKVSEKSYMDREACIPLGNKETIYEIPIYMEGFKVAEQIEDHFGFKNKTPNHVEWIAYLDQIKKEKTKTIKIGMLGKYVEYVDAYMSIIEGLQISANYQSVKIKLEWIQTSEIDASNVSKIIKSLDGVIVLPGFGARGFDGKISAVKYTRENNIPTLGICYGFQAMVVEQAKRMGIVDAASSENDEIGTFVIDIIRETNKGAKLGGTLRLGSSNTKIVKGSVLESIYGKSTISERHRHRYEANPKYISQIESDEFKFSGYDEINDLAENCEISNHKFYIGTQAHPEFNVNPLKEHPLFKAFIKSMI